MLALPHAPVRAKKNAAKKEASIGREGGMTEGLKG
jgi:hypothetical protein